MVGVASLRHQRAVHLDRAGSVSKALVVHEVRDRERVGAGAGGAVDRDLHCTKCTILPFMARRQAGIGRLVAIVLAVATLPLAACSDPEFDTSTPQRALDAAEKMVREGRPDLLPTLIEVKARDLTFDDGVTEASAIGDVKSKLGDMLGRLWRVSKKLRERWPTQVEKELALARSRASAGNNAGGGPRISRDVGNVLSQVMADPFSFLTEQRGRLVAEDMTDGTASLLWDDEPLFQGAITMIETGEGWRFTFPVEFVQSSDFWPQTRHEWAVVASMMLGIENSLKDFERELDRGDFRDLRHASERVGRLIGESVVVQSVIYASMKRGAAGRK